MNFGPSTGGYFWLQNCIDGKAEVFYLSPKNRKNLHVRFSFFFFFFFFFFIVEYML